MDKVPNTQRLGQERLVAVGVFFVALTVYLFTFDGTFSSNNDERALFSGTDSLVRLGSLTINQMYWDYTNVGVLTSHGDMVPNYEPGQMLFIIPFYLWGRAVDAGIPGAMLSGVFVSAAAVAILYLCVLELGYSRRTGLLTAGTFAFATLIWPYSRTLFREPLTVLTYLLALYALFRYRPPAPRRIVWPLLAGISLGVALANKEISIAILPPLGLFAAAYEWRRLRSRSGEDSWRLRIRDAFAFFVPLSVLWLLTRFYTQVTLRDATEWGRDIVTFTTNPQLSSSLPWRMWLGSTGLTISFYRGLFWFSPVLILGLVGFFVMFRRWPLEALTLAGAFAIHLFGYSRYLYWSGGLAWGPRYMLPVVPLLALLAAPVFAWLLRDPAVQAGPGIGGRTSSALRMLGVTAIVLLTVASALVQIPGLAVDVRAWETQHWLEQQKIYGGIGEAINATYMRPSSSPILGHLRVLLSGNEPLDFAWMRLGPQYTWQLVPQGLLLSLAGVVFASINFVVIWRRPWLAKRLGPVLLLASFLLGSGLLLIYRHGDARFDPYDVDRFLRPMIADLEQIVAEGDARCCQRTPLVPADCSAALIVPDPILTDYFLNNFTARMPWYAIDATPIRPDEMRRLLDRHTDLWVARDRNATADDQEGRRDLERYLTENAFKVEEKNYGDWARLLHFSAAGAVAEHTSVQQILGDMSLDELVLRISPGAIAVPCFSAASLTDQPLSDGKVVAHPGDTLQIDLIWRALASPAGNYTVFVQLLDANGQLRSQKDRWPGDGFYPTAALSEGQSISDKLALSLDLPAGQYRLIAGLYRGDLPDYPRLTGPSGDFVMLAEIEIQ